MFKGILLTSLLFFAGQSSTSSAGHTGATAVSGGGGSTPTIVQSVFNSSVCNFGTCGPVTITAGTTGNKLVVELINADSGADVCTDNLSNSLTEQTGSPQATTSGLGSGNFLHEFAYIVPSGGPTSITCTFTGSFAEMGIFEIHGSSASAVMQAFSNSAYSFGNCTPSPSATPTVSPSIAFGVYYADLSSQTPGTGWTTLGSVSTSGTLLYFEEKAQTGTSAVSATLSSNACTAHGPDAFVNVW